MHEHNWIVEKVINMPEDMLGRVEVHEVCVGEGECDRDNEQIRVVGRDRVMVINPN